MKTGRARTLEAITPREWARMVEQTGVAMPYLKRRVAALAEAVAASAGPVAATLAHLDPAFLQALSERVIQRARSCVQSLPG